MYDLCVVGSGPGGYTAALGAAGLGKKVALVEKEKIGGVCLNKGCIPTKLYAQSAHVLEKIEKSQYLGIHVNRTEFNLKELVDSKNNIVKKLSSSLENLIKLKKIDVFYGDAFLEGDVVNVNGKLIEASNIIIAVGSKASSLKCCDYDGKNILSSSDVLSLEQLPKNILIIGGGAIGCEFASIFSSFKTKVTLVEREKNILPLEDIEVSSRLERIFKNKGIDVSAGVSVKNVSVKNGKAVVIFSDGAVGEFENVFVCVGGQSLAADFLRGNADIKLDNGKIIVDKYMKTSKENIYAIGDCTNFGNFYAHTASYCAHVVVDNMFGVSKIKRDLDKLVIPRCIFSSPQVASVGISENDARKNNLDIEIVKLPLQILGIVHIGSSPEGFVKIILDKKSKAILGTCILGDDIVDVITPFVVAITKGLSILDLKDVICAHPTRSEIMSEAGWSF